MTPRATYRLQFHKDFAFRDAIPLAPYFARLGVSHVYSSPILAARPGSMHGYDVIDPTRINPELGGEEDFRALVAALRREGLGLILDIVPNHMAVGGADNPWWLDVLENGPRSRFASSFDIDWEPEDAELKGKVLAPYLGKPYWDALRDGDVKLMWDEGLRKFCFAYAEHRFPLRPDDDALVSTQPLEAWNAPEKLDLLLRRQNFVLAFWREANERLNWRRFFDITNLAALRIEDPEVFEAVHAKLFDLYTDGLVDGYRVDHVDGLTDPAAYCRRLRTRLAALASCRPREAPAGPAYLIVEKICAEGEFPPADWNIDGTSGYGFMNDVSELQHSLKGRKPLAELWVRISGRKADFEHEERMARREILERKFLGQLRSTAHAFERLACGAGSKIGRGSLESALATIFEEMRCYRTYATGDRGSDPGPGFAEAMNRASEKADPAAAEALAFIARAMHGDIAPGSVAARDAVRRFNQLSAPLAAKAVEDTALYRYGVLLSRNDVGFQPATFGISIAEFAARAAERRKRMPHTMLTTATHDHKRGEDVCARLAVLSEWPAMWERESAAWFALNAPLRPAAIDAGDAYQLYQTLTGAWPLDLDIRDGAGLSEFAGRIVEWQLKALREAKLRTSWSEPDADFERANESFVRAILDPARAPEFLARLAAFAVRIAAVGTLNGLVQCVLRATLPGVPDLYQGAEFWDLSLVDPDNRRPVDFAAREAALAADRTPAELLGDWRDGRVKQAVIARLLRFRRANPALFADGAYVPLQARGMRADNVVAYLRRLGPAHLLVAAPRLCADACADGSPATAADFWQGTDIVLPGEKPAYWTDLFSRTEFKAQSPIACGHLFASFPIAVLAHGCAGA